MFFFSYVKLTSIYSLRYKITLDAFTSVEKSLSRVSLRLKIILENFTSIEKLFDIFTSINIWEILLVRYFHFDFSHLRLFHLDIFFISIVSLRPITSASSSALRLIGKNKIFSFADYTRLFHFDTLLFLDIFTSNHLALRYIMFDLNFHVDTFTSFDLMGNLRLQRRYFHFDRIG